LPQSVFEDRRLITGLAWDTPRSVQIDPTNEQKEANDDLLTRENEAHVVLTPQSYSGVVISEQMKKKRESALQARVAAALERAQKEAEMKEMAKKERLEALAQQRIQKREEKKREREEAKNFARLTKKALAEHDAMTLREDTKDSPGYARKLKNPKPRRHSQRGSSWLGNSDDLGSVDSGLLNEEVCFECGASTADPSDAGGILLCDRCDGEFHLKCVGLEFMPRASSRLAKWYCPQCVTEEQQFGPLKFDIEGGGFPIPRPKKGMEFGVCFSPARPLNLAWEECVSKGFMMASKVFSFEVMRKITQGVVDKMTSRGRVAEQWLGAIREVPRRINDSCKNIVVRDNRYDMQLPDFLVEQLDLNGILKPITDRLRTIMGTPTPEIRTHNVVFVPVGSEEQKWHTDDSMTHPSKHRYFTILIHLNPIDEYCGGTEVWHDGLKRGDMMRGRPGDAFIFNGAMLHRGQGNSGQSHRFFYYCSFSCRPDVNVADK
jgi:hypothetical protein